MVVVAFCVSVAPLLSFVPAHANAGKKCTKVGQVDKRQGTICTRVGKTMVWRKSSSSGGTGKSGGSATNTSCPTPVKFTKNFIDPTQVQAVTPIGGQTAFGGSIAIRSYVMPPTSCTANDCQFMRPWT